MLKRLVALSSTLLAFAACGDDKNPNGPDAEPGIDASVDANPIDAMPETTHTATVSILDVRVNGIAPLGSGGQVVASFFAVDGDVPGVVDAVGQIYDDRSPTTGAGCAAFVWDLTVPEIPPMDEGHGAVTITGSTATLPACNFVGSDYLCLGTSGALAGADALVAPGGGGAGTVNLVVAAGAFTTADAGRYVKISGATPFRNNGTFPIVSAPTATLIVFANPLGSSQAAAVGVTYQIVAGAGPVPSGQDFLADADTVTVSLDAPNGDPFEDYTTAATAVGDNFSLTNAAQAKISTMLTDGAEFTLGCNPTVVAHAAGTGPSFAFSGGDVTLTDVTVNFNAAATRVRNGAEVIITGAPTAGNNSPASGFTIISHTDTTLTFANATGSNENFNASTAYTVNDCGQSVLAALNMDFSNAALTRFIGSGSGIGPGISAGCTLTNTGNFEPGMNGAMVTISGAPAAGNNGTFPITGSTSNTITYTNAGCVVEGFAAGTAYETFDDISPAGSSFIMPDPITSHATLIGHIQCAALASQSVTVPAGAAAAIQMVDPNRIRTVFLRGGLAQVANADMTNPSNIIVGHAIVGFTSPP